MVAPAVRATSPTGSRTNSPARPRAGSAGNVASTSPTPRTERRRSNLRNSSQPDLLTFQNDAKALSCDGNQSAPAADCRKVVSTSDGLQLLSNLLNEGSIGVVLYDIPVAMVKRVTAAAADAALGPSAAPRTRLLLRRALRASIALLTAGAFTVRLGSSCDLLAHLQDNPDHTLDDMNTQSQMVDTVHTVNTLLAEVSPSTPLRIGVAVTAIAALLVKLHTASDAFASLDFEHGVIAWAMSVLDLANSGKGLVEKCQGLAKMATAAGCCEGPPAAAAAAAADDDAGADTDAGRTPPQCRPEDQDDDDEEEGDSDDLGAGGEVDDWII